MTDAPAPSAWFRLRRFGFRVALIYLVGYTAPFHLDSLPLSPDLPGHEQITAQRGRLLGWHREFKGEVVRDTGSLLGLEDDLEAKPTGSGDTTHDYLWSLALLYGSLVLGALWTMVDQRHGPHRRLAAWARWWARTWVGVYLLIYGAVKVYQSQFPFFPHRLLDTYGDSSPMGILWTFMGASKAYNVFSGGAEMLGGVLLLFHCTSSLGALVSVAVLANVAMLNFAYDVPVKLFSCHLLAFSAWVLAGHLPRLRVAFLRRTPSVPPPAPPPIQNRIGGLLPLLVSLVLAVPITWTMRQSARAQEQARANQELPFQGIWEVETFTVDGTVRPPLVTDPDRWQYLVVQDAAYLAVKPMTGRRRMWSCDFDDGSRTWSLKSGRDGPVLGTLVAEDLGEAGLRLVGTLEGKELDVRLKERALADFELTGRGFHWISEYPYNR